MNSILSNNTSHIPFHKQTNHAIYNVLGHGEHENLSFPINPNFLKYNEEIINLKYKEYLFFNKTNIKGLSKEFKNVLLVFYLFTTCYLIISIAT